MSFSVSGALCSFTNAEDAIISDTAQSHFLANCANGVPNGVNSKKQEHQRAWGDWEQFFTDGKTEEWGRTDWIPTLRFLNRGDDILAMQTNTNILVGLAKVEEIQRRGTISAIILKPIRRVGVKVRPLKDADPRIAAIPALQPGPIKTIYDITAQDALRLLHAANVEIDASEDAIPAEEAFLEGEERAAVASVRNPQLRRAAKRRWGLRCYCCGFNFEQFFGAFAKGTGVVHHLKTFTPGRERTATVEDVRVVCANCHHALHLSNPPMTVDRLKSLVGKRWTDWSEDGVSRISQ